MVVQHDWNGQNNKFSITPVRGADGKITKDNMNKMEAQRYYNNINDKSIHLKERMEDIPLNIKTLVRYCNNAHYNCNSIDGDVCQSERRP